MGDVFDSTVILYFQISDSGNEKSRVEIDMSRIVSTERFGKSENPLLLENQCQWRVIAGKMVRSGRSSAVSSSMNMFLPQAMLSSSSRSATRARKLFFKKSRKVIVDLAPSFREEKPSQSQDWILIREYCLKAPNFPCPSQLAPNLFERKTAFL